MFFRSRKDLIPGFVFVLHDIEFYNRIFKYPGILSDSR